MNLLGAISFSEILDTVWQWLTTEGLKVVIGGIVLFIVCKLTNLLVRRLNKRLEKRNVDKTLRVVLTPWLGRIIKFIAVCVYIGYLGFETSSISAAIASLGVTVGLALQGSLSNLGSSNSASATIVSGKLKDSSGVLKALRRWGDAVQVTSGGGLVMSNQPVPIQAIQRTAYLAGSSASQSDYGQTTELTPGEVTTGFTATIIPHILDRRRVVLQYNLNLSTLDELTEFSTKDLSIQLPKTSTRAFSQRSQMQLGQTLVLAGFQDETQSLAKNLGLFNLGRSADYGKTLLVVTISVEAAGGGTED